MKWTMRIAVLAAVLAVGPLTAVSTGLADVSRDWRSASRESTGQSPDPATTQEAVVQAFAARAWSWRGAFGVHSWIATKRTGADSFKVYEVVGWRARRGLPVISVNGRAPDGRWFGSEPELLRDMRGPGVEKIIDRIEAAVGTYPYPEEYRVWPGPNSNTFIAHLARAVPELRLDLPPTAIGKDWIPSNVVASAPSGTGFQFNILGVLGLMAAKEEGIEINLLGFTFGIDPLDPALKLPGVGRLGPATEIIEVPSE
ncbi:MAG: DUF3750 domain-containing protein [Rhodospirillales bacterium]